MPPVARHVESQPAVHRATADLRATAAPRTVAVPRAEVARLAADAPPAGAMGRPVPAIRPPVVPVDVA